MPKCIFCENELTQDTTPEHVLLNALGDDDVIAVGVRGSKGPLSSSLPAISRIGGGYEAICWAGCLAKRNVSMCGRRSGSGLVRGKGQVRAGGAHGTASQAGATGGAYRI